MNKPREIYYDINITNYQSTDLTSQPLRFIETRSNPIIKRAGDYSLSIVRFQLDTTSLPLFIADIDPFPNEMPNKMIDAITIEYDDNGVLTTHGPLNLDWISTNKHIATPNGPSITSPLQDSSTEYYYGNSFRHYCDLVNNTFNDLTEGLKTRVGAELDNLIPPIMVWNTDKQIAELYLQYQFYDSKNTKKVKIYFNRPLYAKFTSFPAYKNLNGGIYSKIYEIYSHDDNGTNFVNLDVAGHTYQKYIKVSQEYSTISNWTPISSIVFTTNTLPIFGTQLSEPLVYSNGIAVLSNIPQNFAQIISDMATNDLCYKPNLLYSPSAENRYIDMFGDNDISNIDVNVYWKDTQGHLNPFYLESGASASIKFLFKLKS